MHEPEKRVRAQVTVGGRVQGVWFRASTQDMARSLGLTGYVRNLPDGRVEAVFEGPEAKVKSAIAWCRHGPPGARVSSVDVEWLEPTSKEADFFVRY
jgi:acylphosphatase